MARISFGERYRTDTRFKTAVEDLKTETIFRAIGLTPEMVNEAWDGVRLNVATVIDQAGEVHLAVATQEKSRAEHSLERLSDFLRSKFLLDNIPAGENPVDIAMSLLGQLVPEDEDDLDEDGSEEDAEEDEE